MWPQVKCPICFPPTRRRRYWNVSRILPGKKEGDRWNETNRRNEMKQKLPKSTSCRFRQLKKIMIGVCISFEVRGLNLFLTFVWKKYFRDIGESSFSNLYNIFMTNVTQVISLSLPFIVKPSHYIIMILCSHGEAQKIFKIMFFPEPAHCSRNVPGWIKLSQSAAYVPKVRFDQIFDFHLRKGEWFAKMPSWFVLACSVLASAELDITSSWPLGLVRVISDHNRIGWRWPIFYNSTCFKGQRRAGLHLS